MDPVLGSSSKSMSKSAIVHPDPCRLRLISGTFSTLIDREKYLVCFETITSEHFDLT